MSMTYSELKEREMAAYLAEYEAEHGPPITLRQQREAAVARLSDPSKVRAAPDPGQPGADRNPAGASSYDEQVANEHARAAGVRKGLEDVFASVEKALETGTPPTTCLGNAIYRALQPLAQRLSRLEERITGLASASRLVEVEESLQAKIRAAAANSRRGYE